MHEILDQSWKIFKSQFINKRHEIETEAPFQHHLAYIIRSVGELYSLDKKDLFKVDLEKKVENIRGRKKFFDIACHFEGKINCLIELKFKLKRQAAQDYGRIDAYSDIEALELSTENGNDFGKFYMITDDTTYNYKSVKGVGTIFTMWDGFETEPGKLLNSPSSKGREHVFITIQNKYKFEWEKIDKWYFLDLTIDKRS
ncbi:MAG: hypothetical protein KDC52_00870 [Ignavibacteriae bacterium]|nr:hypothetical protein [Ignavibacteriota bacterium]